MADAGVGRHDLEIFKALLAPAQESVALDITLHFEIGVEGEGPRCAEFVDLHGMIDDELSGNQWIDFFGVAAESFQRVAHGGEVDDRRNSGKILQQDARGHERNFFFGGAAFARGIPAEGTSAAVSALDRTALGISFVEVADPYQSVSRALKYVLLFIGLLFLSYFVFETTAGKRVHPAQYVLVGVAHMIFYLLLLALAERIGFDWGFLVAGGATVLLLSANAQWIFASRLQGLAEPELDRALIQPTQGGSVPSLPPLRRSVRAAAVPKTGLSMVAST